MKLSYKTLFIVIAVLSISCEETSTGSSSDNSNNLESTLNNSELPSGIQGNIDEYFYDLDEGETPYVNSQFYLYSGLSIVSPLTFDPTSDTLNFITVSDYVLSFSPEELIDEMIILEPFDETISLTTGGECLDVDDDLDGDSLTVDCPDINGDGLITGGEFLDLYRFEEINFVHTYTDVLKLKWDDEDDRYKVVTAVGDSSPLLYTHIIGHPDSSYDGGVGEDGSPHTSDIYDSLVYITQINQNDLNGFYFTDEDGNGFWNGDEEWSLPDSTSYQYYFDSNQLSSADSVYISTDTTLIHNFNYNRILIGTDSLMFKISTDCNDDGEWTDAETADIGNGKWDPAEPWLDTNTDSTIFNPETEDSDYNSGDPFLDRNCNKPPTLGFSDGGWDDAELRTNSSEDCDSAETFMEDAEGGFCDRGNGIIDMAEVCWPEDYTDENENQEFDPGEDFVDDNDNGVWDDYLDGCALEPHRLYSISDRPNVLIANYTGDEWVTFKEFGLAGDQMSNTTTPRGSENSYELIQSYDQTEEKRKETSLVNKVETIYSYQFIENTFEEGKDYSISKTIWDDGERSTSYHLYRKDDLTSDIVELLHDSYFILPTTTPGLSIDGGNFEDYLIFDNLPSEQTYLYTYNGLLRDGEVHQTSRVAYSPQTYAQYNIIETYEVISDTLTIPQLNNIYDSGEEYEDDNENQQWDQGEEFIDNFTLLTDAFKISRTKSSIMQGSGLELVELNNIWLARGYGIVRDEMEFRFNLPDTFDGYYRLELINCRHCNNEGASSRASMFTGGTEVDFKELQNTDQFNDSYNKTRTFGLQKLEFNSQP